MGIYSLFLSLSATTPLHVFSHIRTWDILGVKWVPRKYTSLSPRYSNEHNRATYKLSPPKHSKSSRTPTPFFWMFGFPATVFTALDFILVGVVALQVLRFLLRRRIPKGIVVYCNIAAWHGSYSTVQGYAYHRDLHESQSSATSCKCPHSKSGWPSHNGQKNTVCRF